MPGHLHKLLVPSVNAGLNTLLSILFPRFLRPLHTSHKTAKNAFCLPYNCKDILNSFFYAGKDFDNNFFCNVRGPLFLATTVDVWCFNKQLHALMPSWLLLKRQKRWSIIQTANFFTTATNISTGLFIAYNNNNIWQQNVSTIILESYFFSALMCKRI